MSTHSRPTMFCNFCAKSQHEAAHIIVGPRDIHICGQCVDLCREIVEEARAKKKEGAE